MEYRVTVKMKKSKKEKKRKETIRIYFKDGKIDTIPQKLYTDYDYMDRLFVIIRKYQWIAIYNMDDVSCITVG